MKLTIDRNVWLRGEGPVASELLRASDGKRCCVGIYLTALGVSDDRIRGKGIVGMLEAETRASVPGWLSEARSSSLASTGVPSDVTCLYDTNDFDTATAADRERIIAEIFAKHDVEVEFVN
jgi:hypothetical protein